ncbi:MAG: hypothetical protein AAGB04_01995 [Pseudomonadota bacterium]
MTRPIILIIALSLAGCAKPMDIASVTQIKPNTGSTSIDVYEPHRRRGQKGIPDYAGDQFVEVRTYTYKQDEGRVEIGNAQCEVSTAHYSAKVTTPARVRVPLYRGSSSILGVVCEKEGYRKKHASVAPIDIVRRQRFASSTQGGLIGVAVVAVIDAASDNSKNEWRYPTARIILEPVTKKTGKPLRTSSTN